MNKLIITLAMMALSQVAMGEEKNTLEKAQEVAQRMRDAADREYSEGRYVLYISSSPKTHLEPMPSLLLLLLV
jgi:hypothetical protein